MRHLTQSVPVTTHCISVPSADFYNCRAVSIFAAVNDPCMRLGQLARKLNIRPADVIAALPQNSLPPESNSNTRLTDEQVKEVVQFFRPATWETLLQEVTESDVRGDGEVGEASEECTPERPEEGQTITASVELNPGHSEEKPELIKAPKIELPGLKVVGKIELPQKKVNEVKQQTTAEETQPARKTYPAKQTRRQDLNRHKRNPVAVARERQQRELEKQKQLEAEREKERRTKKYQAKVSGLKRIKENKPKATSVMAAQHPAAASQPSSVWEKFKKWLFRE